MMPPPKDVFRILSLSEWAEAQAEGAYHGAAHDRRDGFLHLSARDQVAGTLERHYAGRTDLLILTISVDRLPSPLRWEPSRNDELFPHLYDSLPVTAVTTVTGADRWQG